MAANGTVRSGSEPLFFPDEAHIEDAIAAMYAAFDAVEEATSCKLAALIEAGEAIDDDGRSIWDHREDAYYPVGPVKAENIAALTLLRDDVGTHIESFERLRLTLDCAISGAVHLRRLQRPDTSIGASSDAD